MPLDVHIVAKNQNIPSEYPLLGLDVDVHGAVFYGTSMNAGEYEQLSKMADYYEDTKYVGEDLRQLIRELEQIMSKFADDKPVQEELTRFREICTQADQQCKAVLLFAD